MATTAKRREQEPIDTASALARVEGDVELLKELVALFLTDLPEMLTSLREAVTAGDANAIERAAHRLKGSVGNFAAQPAFEAALKLEVLGRDGRLSKAELDLCRAGKGNPPSQVGDGRIKQSGSAPLKASMADDLSPSTLRDTPY